MTTSWAPFTMWLSFFIGWFSKIVILRISGIKLFRRFQPFSWVWSLVKPWLVESGLLSAYLQK